MRLKTPTEIAVLAATDIVELIGRTVTLNNRSKDHVGLCPFHQGKAPSFTVNQARQCYYCYGCKAGGDAANFVMQRDRVGYLEAIQTLGRDVGMDATSPTPTAPAPWFPPPAGPVPPFVLIEVTPDGAADDLSPLMKGSTHAIFFLPDSLAGAEHRAAALGRARRALEELIADEGQKVLNAHGGEAFVEFDLTVRAAYLAKDEGGLPR